MRSTFHINDVPDVAAVMETSGGYLAMCELCGTAHGAEDGRKWVARAHADLHNYNVHGEGAPGALNIPLSREERRVLIVAAAAAMDAAENLGANIPGLLTLAGAVAKLGVGVDDVTYVDNMPAPLWERAPYDEARNETVSAKEWPARYRGLGDDR